MTSGAAVTLGTRSEIVHGVWDGGRQGCQTPPTKCVLAEKGQRQQGGIHESRSRESRIGNGGVCNGESGVCEMLRASVTFRREAASLRGITSLSNIGVIGAPVLYKYSIGC